MAAKKTHTPDVKEIISIINNYTFLEKKGNIYTGYCPFCNSSEEKLIVRPELNEWHCFECGAGGNVDDFVALYESMVLHRQAVMEVGKRDHDEASSAAKEKEGDAIAEETDNEFLQDNDTAFTNYFSRLRTLSGYMAAAIIDGNKQLIRTDAATEVKTDFNQLNELFINIIDDAHTVFGENLTVMESEIIMSSEDGIVLYSALRFRDEPMHIIVLGKEKRQQHLMMMEINRLKKF